MTGRRRKVVTPRPPSAPRARTARSGRWATTRPSVRATRSRPTEAQAVSDARGRRRSLEQMGLRRHPGHLAYGTLPTGERLLDFSSAGYMGGGVAIPSAPVQETVKPSGGADDTPPSKQRSTPSRSSLLRADLRGAVLLARGRSRSREPLDHDLGRRPSRERVGGRGDGRAGLRDARTVFTIGGTGDWEESSTANAITDDYVPRAPRRSTSPPRRVSRPERRCSSIVRDAAWIHFMGMNTLVRDDAVRPGSRGHVIHADRTIVAVSGNTVTLDAPLSDTFD